MSNWDLVYRHPVHVIGLNLGTLIAASPRTFGEVVRELTALIAVGVVAPVEPASYPLSAGADVLRELEGRATVGKQSLIC